MTLHAFNRAFPRLVFAAQFAAAMLFIAAALLGLSCASDMLLTMMGRG